MSGSLHVIAPGIHATVQDFGRVGYQALGVPVAGALDPVALRLVNALVGNEPGTAAIEYLYQGPTLEVAAEAVRIAAARSEIEVLGEDARCIPPWQSVRLTEGTRFRLGPTKGAVCGYLGVQGGLAVPHVLGSQSTYVRSRIGGFEGRPLAAQDDLPLARPAAEEQGEVRLSALPEAAPTGRVRVVLGPQAEYFTEAAIATFLAETFVVSKDADRMGLRLEGSKLAHSREYDIASDGIATGSIQVPGSGYPIVMLADHQSTGGYPKIATIISADMPGVGRLRPGDTIRFQAISTTEAETARRALEGDIKRRAHNLLPAIEAGRVNETALYAGNLVSGIVSATDWQSEDSP